MIGADQPLHLAGADFEGATTENTAFLKADLRGARLPRSLVRRLGSYDTG